MLELRSSNGHHTIYKDGTPIGSYRKSSSGEHKGRFVWESFLALGPMRGGVADTEDEALAHLGVKKSGRLH